MKIRLAFTLEVDRERWCREYGELPSAEAVREDVRSYFDPANCLPDHLQGIVTKVR